MIFPVCTAEIASRLKTPADLAHETLLYDALWADDWAFWMDHAAPNQTPPHSGPSFSLYSIAVEEAKNGAGVLMGHETLVEQHIKNGTLVAPFKDKIASQKSLNIDIARNAPTSKVLKQVLVMLKQP